jgi:integrase
LQSVSSVPNPSGSSRGPRIAAASEFDASSAGGHAPPAGEASDRARARPSGFVFKLEKARGASWWAKYRLPDGTQVKRKVGPAWTGRGRPAAGYFTKRLAEDWLHDTLEEIRRDWAARRIDGDGASSTRPRSGSVAPARSGATFADAAAEYLRFSEEDRGCKPSTIRNYRNAIKVHLLPVFGEMELDEITVQEIERWRAGMSSARQQRELSNKTKNNLLVLMHAIFRRAVKLYGLPANPVASVDRFRVRSSGDIQVFSPEEVWALVRAAGSEADAAIFLTAAFTGLRRGELLGLRWRDVDFTGSTIRVRASYAAGKLTTPKSGKVRAVPMAPDVASALAKFGDCTRFTGDDDFVFAGEAGLPLDGDALSSRYRDALARAELRPLRFHDLRHTFGTRMIAKADIRRVQEWMGHADIQTTMKYLHYAPREEDAALDG